MTDVNKEVGEILKGLNIRVVYSSPAECGELPAVSYYTLSEKGGFSCDNEESITDVSVQTDIWADEGYKCGMIGMELNSLMREYGFHRELSMDVPKGDDGIYHRTMRFVKSYINEGGIL